MKAYEAAQASIVEKCIEIAGECGEGFDTEGFGHISLCQLIVFDRVSNVCHRHVRGAFMCRWKIQKGVIHVQETSQL